MKDSTKYLPVSVIVPVYNAGEFLETCVDSINKDFYRVPAEIILINDCSTDNSIEIARTLSRKYSNLKIIDTKKIRAPLPHEEREY